MHELRGEERGEGRQKQGQEVPSTGEWGLSPVWVSSISVQTSGLTGESLCCAHALCLRPSALYLSRFLLLPPSPVVVSLELATTGALPLVEVGERMEPDAWNGGNSDEMPSLKSTLFV